MSEAFIEKLKNRVNWGYFSLNPHVRLSMSFYERFVDRLDWWAFSEYHTLSEEMIEKFSDRVDWDCISRFQDLSDAFIEKHWNKIDHGYLFYNPLIKRRQLLDELCWNVGTISEKNNNHFSRDVANEVLGFLEFKSVEYNLNF